MNSTSITIVSVAVTIFCGAIFTWWQISSAKKIHHSKKQVGAEEYLAHRTLKVYLTRRRVAIERIAITDRARAGDTLFGSCKNCYDDDSVFDAALAKAVARGVRLDFVVSSLDSAREFRQFLAGLDASKVRVWTCGDDYPRTYGIEGKEIMFAFDRGQEYLGLHLVDAPALTLFKPGLLALRQKCLDNIEEVL
jgi:hypothetical protein